MKKNIIIILFLAFIFIMAGFITVKREIDFKDSKSMVDVSIPCILITGIFNNYEINISWEGSNKYINLLYNSFDKPLLFVPSKNGTTIYVMYFFDIEDHVFAIELGENNINDMHKGIKRIVKSLNGINVRYLSREELEEVTSEINSMPENRYKQLSVPSLDLGFYKFYMPKGRILKMLQDDRSKRFDTKEQ